MTTINIIFHSVTGHTFRLAEALGEGVSAIKGCRPQLKRIPEPAGADPITMSGLDETVHNYLHIPEAVVEDLVHCDGIALGFSVYWGNMNYAMKHFLDSAAKLWSFASPDKPVTAATELIGKPATVFTGGGTGLGNDAAILGMWTALGFFGMTIVTLGLNVPEISDPSRVGGGSPPRGRDLFSTARCSSIGCGDVHCASARTSVGRDIPCLGTATFRLTLPD